MNIIDVSQENETDAWLEARRGRITGTKSGSLALEHYALTDVAHIIDMADKKREMAGKAKTPEKAEEYLKAAAEYEAKAKQAETDNERYKIPQDYWQYLAELVAEQADGENPMERGHRLENANAGILLQKLGIPDERANFDTGLWLDSKEPRLACSPDVTELSLEPTWAIECKSLGTANHLKAVVPIIAHRRLVEGEGGDALEDVAIHVLPEIVRDRNARDYDFVPEQYKAQALQYFVVDEHLETLYFSFFDPRIFDIALAHVHLAISRDSIVTEIETHRERQLKALRSIDGLIRELGIVAPNEV